MNLLVPACRNAKDVVRGSGSDRLVSDPALFCGAHRQLPMRARSSTGWVAGRPDTTAGSKPISVIGRPTSDPPRTASLVSKSPAPVPDAETLSFRSSPREPHSPSILQQPFLRHNHARYDGLHRVTSITYPYGPNSSNTPGKYFVYDSATVDGVAMGYAKSRLAEAYTATCSTCSKITDEGFSYTQRGEVATAYESTPHSSGYYVATASYWANGLTDNLTAATGYSTNYVPDGEGRVNSAGGGGELASTAYNPASLPTTVTFGSGDSDSFTYDANTFRMTQYSFNVNGQSVVGNLTWNANWSLGKLAITDPFNSANTQTCTYSHDDLARIASGNCGSVWSQTFSYDAFGNITKTGSSQFQPTYSYLTNRMSSIGSFTPSYDANGDVTNDSLNTYAWDSEGRPTTIDGITVTYDALVTGPTFCTTANERVYITASGCETLCRVRGL